MHSSKMKPVKSGNISHIGYDKDAQLLAIQFQGTGKIYHYKDVPPSVFSEFKNAESLGKYFAANIRLKYDSEVYKPDQQPVEA